MKRLIAAALILFAAASYGATYIEQHVVRLGQKVIGGGDTAKKVLESGGEPDGKRDLTNKYGVKVGEEWTYQNGRETIYIDFDASLHVYAVGTSLE